MTMNITNPNVEVLTDSAGNTVGLNHFKQPFTPSDGVIEARKLAAQYVAEVAEIYGFGPGEIKDIDSGVRHKLDKKKRELKFSSEKNIKDLIVVEYEQSYNGLLVFRSGVSVLIHTSPLRVIGSANTTLGSISIANEAAAEKLDTTAKTATSMIERILNPGQFVEQIMAQVVDQDVKKAKIKINENNLIVYHYRADERINKHEAAFVPLEGNVPELRPIDKSIKENGYYYTNEILFTSSSDRGEVHWRVIIEPQSSSVLYVRPFISNIEGYVYRQDPLTTTGNASITPTSSTAVLNSVRSQVTLQGLTPSAPQALSGNYVELQDINLPAIAPPTSAGDFFYDADTDNFTAVNAYHHSDFTFRMVEGMGFNMATYFDGTTFPVRVDHRGFFGGVNAQAPGNPGGNGSDGYRYGVVQAGQPLGIADTVRVVLHEFGHAILWDNVHSPNFGFAHSAGDSMACIYADPGSHAPDRFATFPFVTAANPFIDRRHDRSVAAGWAWGGVLDFGGYSSEQILSTTLFRAYRALGGDASELAEQEWAARYVLYLIIGGTGLLTPVTNPSVSTGFASAMKNFDLGTINFEGQPGGLTHKVIRWAFEKQGAYQLPGAPTPVVTEGAPPDVDVYINDGRHGEYQYLANYSNTTDIVNRNVADGALAHQTPILGEINYIYVTIRNRGTQIANDIIVKGFKCKQGASLLFPIDWKPLSTPQLSGGSLLSGSDAIIGPFEWVPEGENECILMSVQATGDDSNINNLLLGANVSPHHLVPFDNNIAMRLMAVEEKDKECCDCHETSLKFPQRPDQCVSPASPPWKPYDNCIFFYEPRIVEKTVPITNQNGEFTHVRNLRLQFRIIFEHCLSFCGKQQGALIYTTTLLPGEKVRLYQHDRYRKVRSESQRLTLHASFRQTVSALHQVKRTQSESRFTEALVQIRSDDDHEITLGGALFDFSWDIDNPDLNFTLDIQANTSTVSEEFGQTLRTASQHVEAERATVISTYEDQENIDTTSRMLENRNECYAVTYFVRRVNEVYNLVTRVKSIEVRFLDANGKEFSGWLGLDELGELDEVIQQAIRECLLTLPTVGDTINQGTTITLPTDGTIYEPELAHCSSCEPMKIVEAEIKLEKAKGKSRKLCLEAELLQLEIQRRKALLESGDLSPFEETQDNEPAPGEEP